MPREIVKKPRMIYPQIATSLSIAKLSVLAELLFWRILPQADDQGRLPGDPEQLKAIACPMRKELTGENIPDLLAELEAAKLIIRYSNSEDQYIQITKWWDYQSAMRRIFPSQYPPPPNWQDRIRGLEHVEETGPRIAEHGIRDLLLDALLKAEVRLNNAKLVEVNKEVRVGNSYIDLLAKDSEGNYYIIELKRTRLSNSHIEQITKYQGLIERKVRVKPFLLLIGYGMVETFNTGLAKASSISVITYNDQLSFRQVVLSDVKLTGEITRFERHVMLSDVRRPKKEEEEEPETETRIMEPEEEEETATPATGTAMESRTAPTETLEAQGREAGTAELELLSFLETLEGWRFGRADDLAWLREFCQEYPDFNLPLAKACRDYHSGRSPPKHKGHWKNRFREWMKHERQFQEERHGRAGKHSQDTQQDTRPHDWEETPEDADFSP